MRRQIKSKRHLPLIVIAFGVDWAVNFEQHFWSCIRLK